MKLSKLTLTTLLGLFIITFSISAFAQKDIYKKDIIKIKKSGHAGEYKEGHIMNEQIEMDIYVKDFSIDNAKKVCAFYKKFYLERAKKLNSRLTIDVNVWNKKILSTQIDNTALQNKYYHGGITYNYYNKYYFEDIF